MKDKQDVQAGPHKTWHTQKPVDLSSESVGHGEIRLATAKPCVFREIVVRQIMDHRVDIGPISSAEPANVFELEIVLRT